MSPGALALQWRIDGSVGAGFLVLVVAAGVLYVNAAACG